MSSPSVSPQQQQQQQQQFPTAPPVDLSRVQVQMNSSSSASSSSSSSTDEPKPIELRVRTVSGQVFRAQFPSLHGLTVLAVKQAIEERYSIPASFQRHIFAGREIQDHEKCLDVGMVDSSLIHLILRHNGVAAAQVHAHAQTQYPQQQQQPPPPPATVQIYVPMPGIDARPVAAPAVAPPPPDLDAHLDAMEERFLFLQRSSRFFKPRVLIDLIVLLIFDFPIWAIVLGCVMLVTSLYGFHRFRVPHSAVYILYCLMIVPLCIYYHIVYAATNVSRILFACFVLVQLYSLRAAVLFVKELRQLTPHERFTLSALTNALAM